nr:hypothetical protein [Tanacetum cinerariifolium]
TREQSGQPVTRESDDEISVALDPQTLSSGFCDSTKWESVFLGVLPEGFDPLALVEHFTPVECSIGIDPQLLVEHFNPVGDNTCVIESDVIDDSTCLMLLEDAKSNALFKGCFALACLTIS